MIDFVSDAYAYIASEHGEVIGTTLPTPQNRMMSWGVYAYDGNTVAVSFQCTFNGMEIMFGLLIDEADAEKYLAL